MLFCCKLWSFFYDFFVVLLWCFCLCVCIFLLTTAGISGCVSSSDLRRITFLGSVDYVVDGGFGCSIVVCQQCTSLTTLLLNLTTRTILQNLYKDRDYFLHLKNIGTNLQNGSKVKDQNAYSL